MFLSRGHNINAYFTSDHTNTAMDYFNMLANMDFQDPYQNNSNYPALCFVFLKFMHHILWPGSTEIGNGYSLRNNMNAQLGYMLFVGVCILIIWEVIYLLSRGNHWEKTLFAAALIFSGPMAFQMERGNLLLIALTMSLLFLALYDSQSFHLRVVSYICLGVAAAIKIYPAFLGLLVLWKKRYKEVGLLLIIGFVFFVAPFFAFNGIQSLKEMIKGYFMSGSTQAEYGLGHSYSASNLFKLVAAVFGKKVTTIPSWIVILSALFCFALFVISKKEWQKLYAIVLLTLWVPIFSYTYALTFLFLPILSLYFRNSMQQWIAAYTVLFVSLLIPYALPMIDSINNVVATTYVWPLLVSWGTIITNLSLCVIAIMILLENTLFRSTVERVDNWK